MMTLIMFGVLLVINFIVCSLVNLLFGQTRKIDWGISLIISFMVSLTAIFVLGVGPS